MPYEDKKHLPNLKRARSPMSLLYYSTYSWLFREAWAILLMDRIWLALKMGYHLIGYISVASAVEMILNIASFDKSWLPFSKLNR